MPRDRKWRLARHEHHRAIVYARLCSISVDRATESGVRRHRTATSPKLHRWNQRRADWCHNVPLQARAFQAWGLHASGSLAGGDGAA
jgi:hypothetical protein